MLNRQGSTKHMNQNSTKTSAINSNVNNSSSNPFLLKHPVRNLSKQVKDSNTLTSDIRVKRQDPHKKLLAGGAQKDKKTLADKVHKLPIIIQFESEHRKEHFIYEFTSTSIVADFLVSLHEKVIKNKEFWNSKTSTTALVPP